MARPAEDGVDNNATITNLNTGASISASNRNSGWVVGAGVEWAIVGKLVG